MVVTHRPSGIGSVRRAISCVLVANRGEIVVRICRTLTARGMASVAVHTPPDASAPHVRGADTAVELGSYLDAEALVAAALRTGADAVHPGYGFLSEDAGFARAVIDAGLTWIGPPPDAMEQMADKARAKQLVAAAGVPVVPGSDASMVSDRELLEAAREVGFPVLVKPAAGGGGKGMHVVSAPSDLLAVLAAARREAAGAFGDDRLLVERLVTRPRHIEVQVFADTHGHVVHLGERECSLQRRHQKIVEEAPSPLLDARTRRAMADHAMAVASACGYVGAGTVELIVSADRPDEYFFMEMNTRLQVEHPVTELVTGIDLVDWQLQVAAGEPLPLGQDDIVVSGHAVEARLYAEDPRRGFLPAAGTIVAVEEPTGRPGVRVDSALEVGQVVGTRYDPMLAKVVAWGAGRGEALGRLRGALRATTVLGVTTNLDYLVKLLEHPDVAAGRLDTELVERTVDQLLAEEGQVTEKCTASEPEGTALRAGTARAAVAAVAWWLVSVEPCGALVDPWAMADGWRVGGPDASRFPLHVDGQAVTVAVRGRADGAEVQVGGGPPQTVSARVTGNRLLVTHAGVTTPWVVARSGDEIWLGRGGRAWRVLVDPATTTSGTGARRGGGVVTSPMPGVVVALHAASGDRVAAGQVLVAVEAMKMEHAVVSPIDGVVGAVLVRAGENVALDQPLAEVQAEAAAELEVEVEEAAEVAAELEVEEAAEEAAEAELDRRERW